MAGNNEAGNYKVSRELNLSANIGKEEEENVQYNKQFACRYCPYSSNRSYNVRIHEERKHGKREKEDNGIDKSIKKKNQIETVRDKNKHIESMLNSVKTDFERKRELGKIAMEMIDKYELNVHGMPQEVKNAIKFHLKMEGSC